MINEKCVVSHSDLKAKYDAEKYALAHTDFISITLQIATKLGLRPFQMSDVVYKNYVYILGRGIVRSGNSIKGKIFFCNHEMIYVYCAEPEDSEMILLVKEMRKQFTLTNISLSYDWELADAYMLNGVVYVRACDWSGHFF
jgi:hypothetical protein